MQYCSTVLSLIPSPGSVAKLLLLLLRDPTDLSQDKVRQLELRCFSWNISLFKNRTQNMSGAELKVAEQACIHTFISALSNLGASSVIQRARGSGYLWGISVMKMHIIL